MPYYVARDPAKKDRETRRKQYQKELRQWEREKKRNSYPTKDIGGVLVDGRKAFDLETKAFSCAGISVAWALIEEGALVFTGKARPTTGFTKSGIFCEQAYKIYTKEIKELETYNYNKGLNKDGSPLKKGDNNEMAYNSFRDFLTDAQDTYRGASIEAKTLFENWDNAQSAWKEAKNNTSLSREDLVIEEATFLKAQKEFNEGIRALTSKVNAKKASIRKALEEKVNSHYKTDPSRLDANAVKLLEMGIMSASDLTALANENIGNPTMLRVIANYTKNSQDRDLRALSIKLDDLTNSRELETFDSLTSVGDKALSLDALSRRSFEATFEGYSAGCIGKVSDRAFADPVKVARVTIPKEATEAESKETIKELGEAVKGLETGTGFAQVGTATEGE